MNPIAYTDVKGYAAARNVSHRTVQNWLADNRVPGAVKLGGAWSIPIDAEPTTTPQAVSVLDSPADVVTLPEPVALRTRRRPVPVAALAAEWGIPTETVRRWARNGEGGLSLSTGPQSAHYVWVEVV